MYIAQRTICVPAYKYKPDGRCGACEYEKLLLGSSVETAVDTADEDWVYLDQDPGQSAKFEEI